MPLEPFGPSLYVVEGQPVSFHGFPYPTRMAVARLESGRLWVWSPISLTAELADDIDRLGPVEFIVSPNKLHQLFLSEWAQRWPRAHLFAPPGLADKRPDLSFRGELGDAAEAGWSSEIEQAVFRGSFFLAEVVFFHRPSRSLIVGDLIQRFEPSQARGWKGWLMRLDGLVGDHGSTPREWRASFLRRAPARQARAKVLGWQAERLVVAHGRCASSEAASIARKALGWI
ncbi:MAG: DUF4336 domain-containing protein [Burkholderiaceae bacterium]